MSAKKKGITFGKVYIVILAVLLVLAAAVCIYIVSLLHRYEACQPEKTVERTIEDMKSSAGNGTLWSKYSFPDIVPSRYESADIRDYYRRQFADGDLSYKLKQGTHEEKAVTYTVQDSDGLPLADIVLRAVGEPETKLAVFTFQNWELDRVDITVEPKTFTINTPEVFTLKVNGIEPDRSEAKAEENGTLTYTLEGFYLTPDIEITESDGTPVNYKQSGTKIAAEFYDYSLTLPPSIKVTVDGQVSEGEEVPASQGIVRHEIQTLKHPEIIVTDAFGNTVTYDGGSSLPLTYCLLTADTSYSVTVDGEKVPESLVTVTPNPDYEELSKYTEGLPENAVYWIAVLRDNAEIRITDRNGNSETVDPAVHSLDVTGRKTGDGVPANIAAEVDVLAIGEKWSRFMSADLYGDLYGYYDMASYLLYGTYLYDVASRWATSIDITFTSIHTLLDPPFTEERVDNFRQLTDDCFSADVHFVKHMYLSNGEYLDDTMYATLYFLKNESTWNAWKLMQIKEIVE